MTDPELQGFADLWQQPDAAEQAQFEALARKARWHARLLAYADIALAAVVAMTMALGFLLQPGLHSAVIALAVIVIILWLSWKRRSYRQMSKTLDTSNRQAFIESSIRHAAVNLRRVKLSLYIFPPAAVLAILFKLSYRHGGRLDHPLDVVADWALTGRGFLTFTLIAAIVALLVRSVRRYRGELARLDAVERDYQEAARLDGDAAG
jgi:hypothetical protein